MSRRDENRVPYHLDSGTVRNLNASEIRAILRGADSLIASGGRSLLSKLLKGSREKKLLELGLDANPSYGFYRELSIDEVLHRIDWMIKGGYLAIEYQWRLPLLVFTEKGWEIERETYAQELFHGFATRLAAGAPFDMSDLKDRDRGLVLRVLEMVEVSGRTDLIPLLGAWSEIDYKKVRARIRQVIESIRSGAGGVPEASVEEVPN